MHRHLRFQQTLLAFIAGMLLFAQITGLHHHFHREAGVPVHAQASELHFGDAGLHADEHPAAAGDAAATHHAHGDIEVKALGDALAKLALDLPPAGLLMVVALLALPLASPIPRAPHRARPMFAHPFALHPPSNGPPERITPLA